MAVKHDRYALRDDLSMFDLYTSLPAGAREQLLSVVEQVSRAEGDVLFQEGDPPGDCFLVVSGQVGIFIADENCSKILEPSAGQKDQSVERSIGDAVPHSKLAADEVAAEAGDEGEAGDGRGVLQPSFKKEAGDEGKAPEEEGEEVDPLGSLDSTLGPGKPVGITALLQDTHRTGSARCLEDCNFVIITYSDFTRIVKDHMSRDLVEKQTFLEAHLPGLREFSASFVPVTGKSHATYMFVKRRYGSGHVFHTEGSIAESALYVVSSGSVDLYRNVERGKKPSSETYLRQPGGCGRKKICSMLSGGVFATSQVVAAGYSHELFTVVAGSQGCEVWICGAENTQKLSYKMLTPLREHLQRATKHWLDRFSSIAASQSRLPTSPKASPLSHLPGSPKASPMSPIQRSQSSTLLRLSPQQEVAASDVAAAVASKAKRFAHKTERSKVVMPKTSSMPQLLEISLTPADEKRKMRHDGKAMSCFSPQMKRCEAQLQVPWISHQLQEPPEAT